MISSKRLKISAIIFDFDGLLVNTEELRELAIRNFLEKHGKQFNHEDYKETVTGNREEVTKYLKERYKLMGELEDITEERVGFFDQLFCERLALMEGVTELLDRIKSWKIKCGIATGRTKDYVFEGLKRLGVFDYFGAIATADDVVKRKPDPEVYILAAKRLGVNPKFCLALDDSPNGVVSAKRAGMKVIYVPSARYFSDWHDDADLIAKSLHEVTDEVFNKLT